MRTKARFIITLLFAALLGIAWPAAARPQGLEWPAVGACLQADGTVLVAVTNIGDRPGLFGYTPLWVESSATDSWTIYRDLGTLRSGEIAFSVLTLPPDTSGFLWIKTGDVSMFGVFWRWRLMSPIVGPFLTPCPTATSALDANVSGLDSGMVDSAAPGGDLVPFFGPLPCDPSATPGAVLVTFAADTELFWAPLAEAGTGQFVRAGSTAWQVGGDGDYAAIVWSCAAYYVPAGAVAAQEAP